MDSMWNPTDAGATIGTRGFEDGIIIRDDEHTDGVRINLEKDATHAPFAITCGIYGWMIHTRFFSSLVEAEEEYDKMRAALAGILAIIPLAGDPEADMKCGAVCTAISRFVEEFP